jgi:hypothetical protein
VGIVALGALAWMRDRNGGPAAESSSTVPARSLVTSKAANPTRGASSVLGAVSRSVEENSGRSAARVEAVTNAETR